MTMKLDEVDHLILLYIYKRYSMREIGDKVDRAPSVVFRRIKILVDNGYVVDPGDHTARNYTLTELGVRTMQGSSQPNLFPTGG